MDWISEALRLPIAFAQVREDPQIDLHLVRRCPAGARVIMVGSGGCTAAVLAAEPTITALHVVDPNPAQLALCRLKLAMLQTVGPDERRALLGHAAMPEQLRAATLTALLAELAMPADALGPIGLVARLGPDQAGRYEALFRAIAGSLAQQRGELNRLLAAEDPRQQSALIAAGTPLGDALAASFAEHFALPTLVALFGPEATRHPAASFASHFHGRLRHVLATLPARRNHFLHQLLTAADPLAGGGADWLALPRLRPVPQISWSCSGMIAALEANPAAWDLVHLSNILDWLDPPAVRATLDAAWRALRPGGTVLIRQLNSVIDPPAAAPRFDWNHRLAADLHAVDRSFFYRRLLIGRRP